MGDTTFGYKQQLTAGSYWRRRFIALSIGLAVLGTLSWAVSAALSVSQTGGPAITRHGGTGHGSPPRTGGTAPAAAPGKHTGGSQGQPSSHGRTAPATGTTSGTATSPKPTPSGKSSYPGIRPVFCGRRDIVLRLDASQASFGPKQLPTFAMIIVSTQSAECSFNLGPGHLALVIKEGPVRVWSSADCVSGSGSLISALKRGVPTALPITWNRRTSSPGCSGPVTKVPAGVYTGYVTEGSLASAPLTFRIG
jgi:hypothetical protein